MYTYEKITRFYRDFPNAAEAEELAQPDPEARLAAFYRCPDCVVQIWEHQTD